MLVDIDDADHLDVDRRSEHWDLVSRVIDFRNLAAAVGDLKLIVEDHAVDFIVYSQNEQVGKRAQIGGIHQELGLGYTTISGIDRGDEILRVGQMKTCCEDFFECGRSLGHPVKRVEAGGDQKYPGSFSLVFDTEQVGGIRYGVPRILDLLARYGVPATFFVTDLMNRVYGDLFSTLAASGHELAPHGLCHEHLAPMPVDEQVAQIEAMVDGLGVRPTGGNFIYRMNRDTIDAMIQLGFRYFVYFDMCSYRLTSYLKRPTRARLIERPGGTIWAVPIPVETYGSPWFATKNMLHTALAQSRNDDPPHVTVLCHPFRDGGISYLDTTARVIEFLLGEGLSPVSLGHHVSKLDRLGAEPVGGKVLEQILEPKRPGPAAPSTVRDVLGFVPQTALSIARKVSRRTIF